MRSPQLSQLKSMSMEELIDLYDGHAESTLIGTGFLMDEIRYRETGRLNSQIASLTWWITGLTVVITVATIINVIVFLNDSPTISGFFQ